MQNIHSHIARWLVSLPRFYKGLLVVTSDMISLAAALSISFVLRLGDLVLPTEASHWLLFAAAPVSGVVCLKFAGVYRRIIRHVGRKATMRIFTGIFFGVITWSLLAFLSGIGFKATLGIPRSIPIIYLSLAFLFVWSSREIATSFFGYSAGANGHNGKTNGMVTPKNILIWGYGESAVQMARNLHFIRDYNLVGIIDEDTSLHFQKAEDILIYPPDHLDVLISKKQVQGIYLDSSVVSKDEQLALAQQLFAFSVSLKLLPSTNDIISGRVSIDRLRDIQVEDLLGRDPVHHNKDLLETSVQGKSILITGAGGSIGSELARQLVELQPSKLILFDLSEAALYQIYSKLRPMQNVKVQDTNQPVVIAVVGSVADERAVQYVIQKHGIQIIYHAAAYKHVPLMEHNIVTAVENNTFGTWTIARVAKKNAVERFVLISTDKAVRPTNVMGASKRLAEMILQGISAEPDCKTIFCMVRFGNVLDSSGSVVPMFREQITKGWSVTVTHPDIIRYFMLISEAVELVIQAGVLAQKGAVFVLDMGEPVKIVDLARTMISLAGYSVRDQNNPNGDISIEFTGLRSGEKLHEELLIGKNASKTKHPHIQQLDEPFLPMKKLEGKLEYLENRIKKRHVDDIIHLLEELVEGYKRPPPQIMR